MYNMSASGECDFESSELDYINRTATNDLVDGKKKKNNFLTKSGKSNSTVLACFSAFCWLIKHLII